MKAFRVENTAKLKNAQVLEALLNEYGDNSKVLDILLGRWQETKTARDKQSEKAREVVANKNTGKALSLKEKIEALAPVLPALFEAQASFEGGFIINASVLSDMFFKGQFAYGQKAYEAYQAQIDKANEKADKKHNFERYPVGHEEAGKINTRKANGGLKSASIKADIAQDEYLLQLAGIVAPF